MAGRDGMKVFMALKGGVEFVTSSNIPVCPSKSHTLLALYLLSNLSEP